MSAALTDRLAAVVGATHVLTDPAMIAGYATDWTGRYVGHAACVVRPANTEQVAECVRICAAAGAPVTPQGGNTGLVGGSVPGDGGVVLSLRRLDRLGTVEPNGQLSVSAGVTLSALQRHAAAAGWAFGVDLGSRDSATVGGMVATNAGGIRVVRHGSMRAQVLGVEVVLASGAALRRMSGLVKDNSGYELAQLFTGSEGTLGVVTEVALRLVPAYRERVVALAGIPGVEAAIRVLDEVRRSTDSLYAAELMLAEGVELVCRTARLRRPLAEAYPAYLLLELAGPRAGEEQLAELLGDGGVDDAVIASDATGRAALWRYREAHTEAVVGLRPVKLDVGVPPPRMAELVHSMQTLAADRATTAYLYGHLAEANLHVNIAGAAGREDELTDAVLRAVAALGGTISSEHGIGRGKCAWLHLTRDEADIDTMRALKAALDPHGVLNPGVLLP